jgi:threonine synthase
MTDDIVTRLRGVACPECGLPSTHNLFYEAADEIERLRTMTQSSYALRPEDTLVINVPMDTDPEVCEYLTTSVPEHIRGRVVVVRSGCR